MFKMFAQNVQQDWPHRLIDTRLLPEYGPSSCWSSQWIVRYSSDATIPRSSFALHIPAPQYVYYPVFSDCPIADGRG